jgi:L,D-transpeptidase YcbB
MKLGIAAVIRLPSWALASALVVAASAPSPSAAQSLPVARAVDAAYETYHIKPIWFRSGVPDPAVARLIAILQRAPLDGFAEGPALAAQVQTAAAQAAGAPPSAIAAADKLLSAAWVQYVQALIRPTPGMIYAIPAVKPQAPPPENILLTAAAAPLLDRYLMDTSNLNPIYSQLRDAAIAEAQASGNTSPDPRLLANLDRARSIPASGRFMIVDSATQLLTLYEDGKPVDSMKVIVGTTALPTPLISSTMYYLTYNPYWHAPDHLVRKTIAPNVLRLGLKYFTARGYHVIDEWSENAKTIDPSTIDWKAAAAGTLHLRIRQDPGRWNSMGNLKFPFPNPQDIYLHDTPVKEPFSKADRHLSNGCVRVEEPVRLARWLLGADPVAPGTEPEIRVQLPRGVPIILTYLTAQVEDRKITYLPDVYGWDASVAKQIAVAQ